MVHYRSKIFFLNFPPEINDVFFISNHWERNNTNFRNIERYGFAPHKLVLFLLCFKNVDPFSVFHSIFHLTPNQGFIPTEKKV